MAYRYKNRRSTRRLTQNSKRNFIITLSLIALLLYATITWVLPFFINSLGLVKNIVNPSPKVITAPKTNATLAPPILNIPYEATNSAQINIKGYSTPKSKVKLYIDDKEKQTIETEDNGNFTFENVDLNLGTNNIYAKTIDWDNTESLPSKLIKLIYDNQKPNLILNEPEDNRVIQGDKKVKFSGKTDPDNEIFINDSRIIIDKDGNFNTEQPLNDGDNNFNIKAVGKTLNITEISRKIIYNP